MKRPAPNTRRVPGNRIAAVFAGAPGPRPAGALSPLCRALYTAQTRSWPALARTAAELAGVRLRDLSSDGWSLKVQYNPARLKSGGARVDPASIAARPCFLCPAALPPEQRGILYQEDCLILCNPAPIFPGHFTIASLAHEPQAIEARLEAFLDLARDLGDGMTLFYNGPACGASAPDHLHFQAASAGAIPIEKDLAGRFDARPARGSDGVDRWGLVSWGRTLILVRGRERTPLADATRRLIARGGNGPGSPDEPMLNLLAGYRRGEWRLCLFPRRRHRPAAYDRPDSERLLVSPGAVDMGGLVVAPREREFTRLNAPLLRDIYREVSAAAPPWADLFTRD